MTAIGAGAKATAAAKTKVKPVKDEIERRIREGRQYTAAEVLWETLSSTLPPPEKRAVRFLLMGGGDRNAAARGILVILHGFPLLARLFLDYLGEFDATLHSEVQGVQQQQEWVVAGEATGVGTGAAEAADAKAADAKAAEGRAKEEAVGKEAAKTGTGVRGSENPTAEGKAEQGTRKRKAVKEKENGMAKKWKAGDERETVDVGGEVDAFCQHILAEQENTYAFLRDVLGDV